MSLARTLVFVPAAALAGGLLVFSIAAPHQRLSQDVVHRLPALAADPASAGATETAVLAGGCFWGVQGVFAHVKGVRQVVSGYSGGAASTADYETVSAGATGHAESVKIVFDPSQVSYAKILQIFFSVATDPTQLNHQFPDEGPQYRSEVFYANHRQQAVAKAYIDQLSRAQAFRLPIVTRVDPLRAFYPAEAYHQDYLTLHPQEPYVASYDLPKIAALQTLFPESYRADPVLAGGGAGSGTVRRAERVSVQHQLGINVRLA